MAASGPVPVTVGGLSANGASSITVPQRMATGPLTEEEQFVIQECQKIVQFRDKILSGTHRKIQLPPQFAAKGAPSQKASAPEPRSMAGAPKQWSRSRQANHESVGVGRPPLAGAPIPSSSKPFATRTTEINPIFLEKSDELIRAELKLERDKLERAIREEVDQQKRSKFTAAQAELPQDDLDVSDVFAKAQEFVQAAAGPPVPGTGKATNAAADEDTSFDENDYYSSRHDTLESRDTAAEPAIVEPVEAVVAPRTAEKPIAPPTGPKRPGPFHHQPPAGPRADGYPPAQPARYSHQTLPPPPHLPQDVPTSNPAPQLAPTGADSSGAHGGARDRPAGQELRSARSNPDRTAHDSLESGEATQSDASIRPETVTHPQPIKDTQLPPNQPRAAPLVRSHNLTPIAPQAAHISSLLGAQSGLLPSAVDSPLDNGVHRGAPAQVAALRGELRGISSPESSSPRAKAGDKRKGKKKNKRKADGLGQDASSTPYIKPEPRSPSPVSTPINIRPAKRPKHGQPYGLLPEDLTQSAPGRAEYNQGARPDQAERVPTGYGRRDDLYQSGPGGVEPAYSRLYRDDPRATSQFSRQGQSPGLRYPVRYADEPPHPVRSASQALPGRGYFQDEYARVDSDGLGPGLQRPPPRRVLVDEYGREYLEPQPLRQSVAPPARYSDADVIYEGTAPIRHSVAPQVRPRDADIIYERTAPVPAMARRAGPEMYEEDGVVYRRLSPPPYMGPRRVITQPEFGPSDGLAYQPRGYSVRPVGPPVDEYAADQGFADRRAIEAPPRQYLTRSASVRPLEPVRYEYAADTRARVRGLGPEAEYAPLSRPESRVELMAPPPARDYGPRHVVQRSYSVRPVEQYYSQPAPLDDGEVTYIERPPVRPDVVYAGEPRREVYR